MIGAKIILGAHSTEMWLTEPCSLPNSPTRQSAENKFNPDS